MPQITHKGKELALQLGYQTEYMQERCSLICRHAVTYATLQERWCSVEMTTKQVDAHEHKEILLETRIIQLAREIDPQIKVEFEGDQMGATVKLLLPSGRLILVPGS